MRRQKSLDGCHLIVECSRAGSSRAHEELLRVAALLHPGNIMSPHPTRVIAADDLSVVIVNPGDEGVRTEEGGVLLGGVIGEAGRWSAIGSDPPDGTYAIARYSEASIELVSDVVASRTLWYVHDDDGFRASTSQRALVALLGDFDLNEEAVAWMMTAGSLGPEASWDARIRCLPGDARLHLDRRTWRLTLAQRPAAFEPVRRTRREHLGLLREALLWSCGSLDIDTDRWLLPLGRRRQSCHPRHDGQERETTEVRHVDDAGIDQDSAVGRVHRPFGGAALGRGS